MSDRLASIYFLGSAWAFLTCRSYLYVGIHFSFGQGVEQSGFPESKSFHRRSVEALSWSHVAPPLHSSCSPSPLQKYNELRGKGPFTVFVPHADLMTNLSQVTQTPGARLGRDERSVGVGNGTVAPPPLPPRLPTLSPHDFHSRLSWPGSEPTATWCFATTSWAAGSCGARICWRRAMLPRSQGTRCASARGG